MPSVFRTIKDLLVSRLIHLANLYYNERAIDQRTENESQFAHILITVFVIPGYTCIRAYLLNLGELPQNGKDPFYRTGINIFKPELYLRPVAIILNIIRNPFLYRLVKFSRIFRNRSAHNKDPPLFEYYPRSPFCRIAFKTIRIHY